MNCVNSKSVFPREFHRGKTPRSSLPTRRGNNDMNNKQTQNVGEDLCSAVDEEWPKVLAL